VSAVDKPCYRRAGRLPRHYVASINDLGKKIVKLQMLQTMRRPSSWSPGSFQKGKTLDLGLGLSLKSFDTSSARAGGSVDVGMWFSCGLVARQVGDPSGNGRTSLTRASYSNKLRPTASEIDLQICRTESTDLPLRGCFTVRDFVTSLLVFASATSPARRLAVKTKFSWARTVSYGIRNTGTS